MAEILQVKGLTKSVGDRLLWADADFVLEEGDKVAIVARNGTGKSTLMRILAGLDSADSGEVILRKDTRVGYLEQVPRLAPGVTVAEACRQLAADAGIDIHEAGYDGRQQRMLHQLGIEDDSIAADTLSGGERKRVALAALLLAEPQLLLLDEPTNHLDVDIVEWLQKRLQRLRTTLLLVTHDRYFLDRVADSILEIEGGRVYMHRGKYDNFLRRRAERIEGMEAAVARARNTLRREQEWMSRQPQARGGKAKYRIDAFYELKAAARGERTRGDVSLRVDAAYIGNKIFEAEGVCKSYGDKVLLRDFSYTFARREKVGIIGRNGVGKSTLIKLLQGLVQPDAGTIVTGDTVRYGYYRQEGLQLDENKRVADAVADIAEDIRVGGRSYTPMQFLTWFLFTPEEQRKYVSTLSGGERARLHLATVLMRSPNFLILDEPTNDLDLATLGVLEEYLASFQGCVIVVSHDRFFLDSIADHLFVLEGDGVVKDFPGTYSEYREWREARAREQERVATPAPARQKRERAPRLTWAQQRQMEQLERDIETLTTEKATLEALFARGGTPEELTVASQRHAEVSAQLDDAEMQWLELSELSAGG